MIEACREFAMGVIPELRQLPFHIIGNEAMRGDAVDTEALLGWASEADAVSALLPVWLGSRERLQGPTIFINFDRLKRLAYPGYYERSVFVVLTH